MNHKDRKKTLDEISEIINRVVNRVGSGKSGPVDTSSINVDDSNVNDIIDARSNGNLLKEAKKYNEQTQEAIKGLDKVLSVFIERDKEELAEMFPRPGMLARVRKPLASRVVYLEEQQSAAILSPPLYKGQVIMYLGYVEPPGEEIELRLQGDTSVTSNRIHNFGTKVGTKSQPHVVSGSHIKNSHKNNNKSNSKGSSTVTSSSSTVTKRVECGTKWFIDGRVYITNTIYPDIVEPVEE